MMATTQDHIIIQDIKEGVVILKNGNLAIVLQTSAVNFGLLSENEQLAIISSFAGLLNSLSFPIQIVIRSKRLDLTNYLKLLDNARAKQTNRLLTSMIDRYRAFIKQTVKENEVLDKSFYIVVPMSYLEVGISKKIGNNFKKVLTVLMPRRDHLIRQMARVGLRVRQLDNEELTKLFYDIYNGNGVQDSLAQTTQPQNQPTQAQVRIIPQPYPSQLTPKPQPISLAPSRQSPQNIPNQFTKPLTPQPYSPSAINQKRVRSPYIVEELTDEYSAV